MPSTTRNIPSKTASSSLKKPTSVGLSRLHAVAAAVVLCTGLAHTSDALALALGRIAVQSALGEPLRAEIDVPDISAEEASSLRVGLASPEAFRAAGMEFNPALGSAQISLQRRPDGRAFLRLTSPRPINEPFVDLIVEANWASGRILRDYTLLIDPPKIRAATPVAPVPAAAAPARPTPAPAPAPVAAQPLPPVVAPAARAPAQAPVRAPAAAQPAAAPQAAGGQVRVRAGDTAGRIANANRPANVSLDQMLVAMLRANPDAFIDGNVNRVKAGSIIDLPGAADAGSTSAGEARQIIAAQSRDFNEFRRSLANRVPAAAVDAGSREAAGRVQAEVQDQAPAAPAQDKLTLSKGDTPAATAAEEKIAQDRQAQDASTRVAELSRNIDELAKLGTTTAAATAAASASPGATPTSAVTLPGAVPTTTETTASTPEADTATATAPTEAAPAVAEPAPAAAPAPLPVPEPMLQEPSLLEQLQENPLVLPAAGGLLALLAGFGLYRMRQRKKGAGVDSSFLESRLQPDSFFGSSGGQRIDTAEASASGSSMVYSPSQLDAAGDVDPVAEADVYLAYGRDLQAEEILKEAMRSTPTRVAIHNKLLEIYAKRRDAKAFEVVATEAYALTQGQGPEWEQACALGKELDPSNPLYQPGGAPAQKVVAMTAAGGAMTVPFGSSTMSETTGRVGEGALDLDLDFSTDEPAVAADDVMSALDDLKNTEALTEAKAPEALAPESGPMDFDLDFPSEPAPLQAAKSDEAAPAPAPDVPMFDDSEVLPDFALDAPSEPAPLAEVELGLPESAAAATAVENNELMSFDLSNINLDLDTPEPAAAVDKDLSEENPLETKLSLAEEFRAIGDLEGARSLAEEVLAEASGTLKTKASTFLSDLA
ncbi:FimV/HubP family polar landmark protein [Hydrogenophaga sp.]|uniref:FimV/HubP family polar landmark protein n=1 Tax=Hydrogenophaga sp. TaxID=1904254 RepID=UPI0025BF01C1|nr:FimV/HubP family polar landmark protein [Hydrogenophaga sp.]